MPAAVITASQQRKNDDAKHRGSEGACHNAHRVVASACGHKGSARRRASSMVRPSSVARPESRAAPHSHDKVMGPEVGIGSICHLLSESHSFDWPFMKNTSSCRPRGSGGGWLSK
jgi:hypothetical protein